MINAEGLHIKKCNKHSCRNIAGYLFFITAIITSSVLCLYSTPVNIEKPIILLIAAIFTIFTFKSSKNLSTLQKIVCLYLIEMLFNQTSQQFIQIPSGRENLCASNSRLFSVHLLLGIHHYSLSFSLIQYAITNSLVLNALQFRFVNRQFHSEFSSTERFPCFSIAFSDTQPFIPCLLLSV